MAYALHMTSFLVKLAAAQLKALRAMAKKTGLSVSEHIRRAVDAYLKEIGK